MSRVFAFPSNATIFSHGCSVTLCGPQTGHSPVPIAFCEDAAVAEDIAAALKLANEVKHGLWVKKVPLPSKTVTKADLALGKKRNP